MVFFPLRTFALNGVGLRRTEPLKSKETQFPRLIFVGIALFMELPTIPHAYVERLKPGAKQQISPGEASEQSSNIWLKMDL